MTDPTSNCPDKARPRRVIDTLRWTYALLILMITSSSTADSTYNPLSSYLLSIKLSDEPISPVPNQPNIDTRKIVLGKKLFNDSRFDKKKKFSCSSCHKLGLGGADWKSYSDKSNGRKTPVNTPTIFNVGLNSTYYWSGKFKNLSDQLDDALQEINTDWNYLITVLNSLPEYQPLFSNVYSDGISVANVKDALVSYEKSLLTPDSRFDRYLKGDDNALSQEEKQGYYLFKSYGCTSCHQGVNVGGNMLIPKQKQTNRLSRVNRNADSNTMIRVPSLRNVALTAPYFHDGSIKRLTTAIKIMANNQIGGHISQHDVSLIAKFLYTLSGKLNGNAL